jgi:hypothetical protein
MQHGDHEGATGVVAELVSYSPQECYGEIEAAFRLGLVDRMVISEKTFARSISEGEAWFDRCLQNCPPTGIQDTVQELESWACFREPDPRTVNPRSGLAKGGFPEDDWSDLLEKAPLWQSEPTIQDRTARVGRNDPCPCGSGKKYKKCCGRK